MHERNTSTKQPNKTKNKNNDAWSFHDLAPTKDRFWLCMRQLVASKLASHSVHDLLRGVRVASVPFAPACFRWGRWRFFLAGGDASVFFSRLAMNS